MQRSFQYKDAHVSYSYRSGKLKKTLKESLNKLWDIHMIEYDSP